jgi:ACS family glucarate transporter-like MFS transporter
MKTATIETPRTERFVTVGVTALMVAFSVMSYFDRTIMSIAGPGIMREFKLSETQMGAVYSSFLLGYALLMIPGGRLADRFGPRLILAATGLGAALLTGLTALGGRPGLGTYLGVVPAFVLIRLGLGVSTAPLYPSCGSMNANWFPEAKRGEIWGFIAAGAGVGGAVSPHLFSWMIARQDWRVSFWLAAAATALLALVWYWYARDYPWQRASGTSAPQEHAKAAHQVRKTTPWRRLLTNRNLMLLTLGYTSVDYFEYLFFYWIFYYFGQVRKLDPGLTAACTAALFMAWTVMTPLGGWISDRLVERHGLKAGRRLVPMVGLTMSAVLLTLGTNVSQPLVGAALLSLALGCASASDGPFWATAIDIGGADVGAAGGILNTGGNLGGFLAPIITPYIASRLGWTWGLNAGSLIVMLGVLVWFFIDPTKSAADRDPGGVT